MKKVLGRIRIKTYYYENGKKIFGCHSDVSGDLNDVSGDLTGVYGDLNGVSGNLNDAEITDDERKNGVRVSDLIVDDTKDSKI